MAKKRKPFFRRRKYTDDDYYINKPPRKKIPLKKGIFILPSLLTLTSIFFAFYAIILSTKGQFAIAAALILVAGFFDGIDGKVARLTNTTTRFGLELDSLADVISFGVAPAVIIYIWALAPLGSFGWASSFLFVACGALRLARFNVQSGVIDPKRFNGLPIPAAAVMMATTVLFFYRMEINPDEYQILLLILNTTMAVFMVSSIKFHAFKDLTIVRRQPFSSTVAFVLLMALVAVAPFVIPFLLCAAYVISGPILTIVLYARRRKTRTSSSAPPAADGVEQQSLKTDDPVAVEPTPVDELSKP